MSTQEPRDDERDALIAALFYDDHGQKVFKYADPRILLDVDEFLPGLIPAIATWADAHRPKRPESQITEAEALRLGKAAWVAYQGDTEWAQSVVEDCFSPADDLPEEALDMIAVARAVAAALRVPIEGEAR